MGKTSEQDIYHRDVWSNRGSVPYRIPDCSDIAIGSCLVEILAETADSAGTVFTITAEKMVIDGEYDKPITLADIRAKHPTARMITVIVESALHGLVFRFGNHGEFWEHIGNTTGYA